MFTTLMIAAVVAINPWQPKVATMAAAVAATRSIAPVTPVDTEVCENCNGTGKIGDGTVMFTCTVCDGTGKITKEELENLHGVFEYKRRVRAERQTAPSKTSTPTSRQ